LKFKIDFLPNIYKMNNPKNEMSIIENLKTQNEQMRTKLVDMCKYEKDLEGIISRQHEEIRYMKDELRIRGEELNSKNVKICELNGKDKERETSMNEIKLKFSILLRKMRELEEEIESIR